MGLGVGIAASVGTGERQSWAQLPLFVEKSVNPLIYGATFFLNFLNVNLTEERLFVNLNITSALKMQFYRILFNLTYALIFCKLSVIVAHVHFHIYPRVPVGVSIPVNALVPVSVRVPVSVSFPVGVSVSFNVSVPASVSVPVSISISASDSALSVSMSVSLFLCPLSVVPCPLPCPPPFPVFM